MIYTIVLVFYCIFLFLAGTLFLAKSKDLKVFNLANEKLNWVTAAFSIAATWIWAPALFVAGEKAFTEGLIGFGWFFVPNILTLIFFGYIAKRALKKRNDEHTIAELISNLYNSKRLKIAHDFELLVLIFCSTGVQLLAGGLALSFLLGVNFTLVTVLLAVTAFAYSYLKGLNSSVRTDFIQMVFMMLVAIAAPLYMLNFGGLQLGGINNQPIGFFTDYNWQTFLAFGLTVSIGLIAGPMGDQTFWQRAFSMDRKSLVKSFSLGALIFSIVPLGMSLLGFMAAKAGFVPDNVSMVSLEYLVEYGPTSLVILLMLAVVSGLTSTLDSNMCAIGSIFSRISPKWGTIKIARYGMLLVAIFGIMISNIPNINIFWLFLFYGVLRSSVFIPTLFTMVSEKLPSEKSVFWGIILAFTIGVPVYLYGAIVNISWMSLSGTLLTIVLPLVLIVGDKIKNKKA